MRWPASNPLHLSRDATRFNTDAPRCLYPSLRRHKAAAFQKASEEPHPELGPEYFGPQKCVDGMAGAYPCNNFDLVSFVSTDYIDETSMSDVWGWTDTEYDGHEYVIQGTRSGTCG